ncbi:excalibur calcium-binding domain-containing protein [Symbiopectobacterium purcellii]|nr:excalibur calcium-binding domain-containing protein [Symbiopectobacterium purcellii]
MMIKISLVISLLALYSFTVQAKYSDANNPTDNAENWSTKKNYNNSKKRTSTEFVCDGRQYCTQMRSKEEAIFFIQNCPNTKMDGDNDGDPCENDTRFGKKRRY